MARINIEDSLYKDRRFLKLITKLGCEYKALGYVFSAWSLAQEHWLKYRCVPKKAWPEELNILIEVQLAERTLTDDVYIKGSNKAFKWLEQRSLAGKSKSSKKTKNLKKTSNVRSSYDERGSNGSEPPYSLLSSHYSNSLISQNEKIPEPNGSGKPEKKKVDKINTKPLWDAYEKAYFKRWETKPLRNQKSNSQMLQFAKRVGVEDAPKVLEFYVRHNEAKYIASMHSIGYALTDAESLYVQWKRNFAITFNDIRQSQYEANRG